MGEFEGILQQISDRRIKLVAIATDGKSGVYDGNCQYASANLSCKVSGIFHFSYEVGDRKQSGLLGNATRCTSLFQRMINKITQAVQTAPKD